MVELVRYWVNQDWPLTQDKVSAAMAGIGWKRARDGDWQASTDPLYRQLLFVGVSRNDEFGIDDLSWNLTDVVLEESLEREVFLNDAYVGFVKALAGVLGKPKRMRSKLAVTARWDVSNGCRVEVMNDGSSVTVYIESPSYTQVLRNSERR
ncbi:MAG: DUF6301 family protein [Propionibacteriaceae bacterium]|nr:DUF6301 family protein [Propionibacteriaceae bacterium]